MQSDRLLVLQEANPSQRQPCPRRYIILDDHIAVGEDIYSRGFLPGISGSSRVGSAKYKSFSRAVVDGGSRQRKQYCAVCDGGWDDEALEADEPIGVFCIPCRCVDTTVVGPA